MAGEVATWGSQSSAADECSLACEDHHHQRHAGQLQLRQTHEGQQERQQERQNERQQEQAALHRMNPSNGPTCIFSVSVSFSSGRTINPFRPEIRSVIPVAIPPMPAAARPGAASTPLAPVTTPPAMAVPPTHIKNICTQDQQPGLLQAHSNQGFRDCCSQEGPLSTGR